MRLEKTNKFVFVDIVQTSFYFDGKFLYWLGMSMSMMNSGLFHLG